MIGDLGAWIRLMIAASHVAWDDLRVVYTWRSWLGGWLVRVVFQIVLYASLGLLIEDRSRMTSLLVGSSVIVAASTALTVVSSSTWERRAGTLGLLVSAPTPLSAVILGRSVEWVADGVVSATVGLAIVNVVLSAGLPASALLGAIPILFVITVATYMFGAALAAIVLRKMYLRTFVANVAYFALSLVTGALLPLESLPTWMAAAAHLLPMTNGVSALQRVITGGSGIDVLPAVFAEGAVALLWFAVALVGIRWFAEKSRHDGTLEFA